MENYELYEAVVKIDEQAPKFEMPFYDPAIDDEGNISLQDLEGKWSVLFFYPADFTFVCPTELKDMAEAKPLFDTLKAEVLAVSTDTVYSHRAWVKSEKLMESFPYKMLSDHNLEASELYSLLDQKTGLAGRGTFIIDPKGIVRGIEITSGPLGRNSDELLRKIQALQFMDENPGNVCPAKWALGAKTIKPSIKISGEIHEALEK